MEDCDKLFVYGTLRKDFENPYATYLRAHTEYLGRGYFYGQLYDVGAYPGAIYDPRSNEKVFGDLLLIKNNKILEELDAYEGIGKPNVQPYEYKREIVVTYKKKQFISCWTYLYNFPVHHLKKIHSGNYVQYCS